MSFKYNRSFLYTYHNNYTSSRTKWWCPHSKAAVERSSSVTIKVGSGTSSFSTNREARTFQISASYAPDRPRHWQRTHAPRCVHPQSCMHPRLRTQGYLRAQVCTRPGASCAPKLRFTCKACCNSFRESVATLTI